MSCGRQVLVRLGAFAATNGISLPTTSSSVPEPASVTMLVMTGLGMVRRRRRSSRQTDPKTDLAAGRPGFQSV